MTLSHLNHFNFYILRCLWTYGVLYINGLTDFKVDTDELIVANPGIIDEKPPQKEAWSGSHDHVNKVIMSNSLDAGVTVIT